MKRTFYTLLLLLMLPTLALAQSQGQDMSLGAGGQSVFCRTNEAGAALATGDGKANYIACDTKGRSVGADATAYTFSALVGTVQTVKSTAGSLVGWYLFNPAATTCYIQIFDTAGSVTLGTTAPALSFGLPAGGAANVGSNMSGVAFANAIKIASTTTRAGSTPCGTGSDVNFWYR